MEYDGPMELNRTQVLVYPKYFTFSMQLLEKLEFDLLCKLDYSDK